MEHILKLKPKYFNYINRGTKRIELRLYDEKRKKINIGDTIIFQKEPELDITNYFVNLVGVVVFSILGYLYIKNREKNTFASQFMPKRIVVKK